MEVKKMTKEIIIKPHVDYDGILTQEERKKILMKIESAFGIVGADIPREIEIDGEKFKLRNEIQDLIMKEDLSTMERIRIEKLITKLEAHGKKFKNMITNSAITEEQAMELADMICGLLRAVHKLRQVIQKAPQTNAYDAKDELMKKVEDEKRWVKFSKKIK